MKVSPANKSYPSKILIFGEYAVISGGKAIAIPYQGYSGHWTFDKKSISKTDWVKLNDYLSQLNFDPYAEFQSSKFLQDVSEGLSFESNIPMGYGLGSSGALTAAIFDQYFNICVQPDLKNLKEILSKIESFFHGKSSGLDPVTAYINKSIIVNDDNTELLELSSQDSIFTNWYLKDSNIQRSTALLVKDFKDLIKTDKNSKLLYESMCNENEIAIAALLQNNHNDLNSALRNLSIIQFQLFYGFNPPHINKMWQSGLDSGGYFMKLCGAGGGGFYFLISATDGPLTLDENLIKIYD